LVAYAEKCDDVFDAVGKPLSIGPAEAIRNTQLSKTFLVRSAPNNSSIFDNMDWNRHG